MEMEKDVDRKRQFWASAIIGLLLIISVWYYAANPVYIYIVAYLWFGFAYGVCQQWGRFCFASAWRDLIMLKVTRMFVGIMIGLMTLSIISAYLAAKGMHNYSPSPLGLHELAGGILFGFGMVLAGGCATGSLYKTGEGNMTSATVLMALSFSQAIFVATVFDGLFTGYISKQPKILISEYFEAHGNFWKYFIGDALVNTILVGTLFLVLVYAIVVRRGILEQRTATADGGTAKLSFREDLSGFWGMITASRRTSIAGVLLGILAALQVYTQNRLAAKFGFANFGEALTQFGFTTEVSRAGQVFDPGFWYITTQEAQFAAWVMEKFGSNMKGNLFFGVFNGIPAPWHNPPLLLSFGLIMGAAVMALLSKEFKWKLPNKELFVYALIGGTVMGFGSRIALGCNIGGFYTRAAFGNPGGWIFFIGMGAGALVGARLINWWAEKKMAEIQL